MIIVRFPVNAAQTMNFVTGLSEISIIYFKVILDPLQGARGWSARLFFST